jgi:hypothetical protein
MFSFPVGLMLSSLSPLTTLVVNSLLMFFELYIRNNGENLKFKFS